MLRTKKEVDRHVRELLNKIHSEDDRKSRGYNIARFYFNVDEYESARRYLSEFLSLRPKSSDAHKLMGQLYEKLGQKEKAIQCYKTAYSISDTHRDLVPKICGLFAEMNCDAATKTHWVDEGERLFPHHINVINLRESIMMASSNQSKEEQEKFYLREIKANPLSLCLHMKLVKLLIEWGKELPQKYDKAFEYVISIETRRPFPHSLEWYQIIVEVLKAYEKWKKPSNDPLFEEIYLTILDRFVFESLASSCGPALSSLCSVKGAAQRLEWFGSRLAEAIKLLGADSVCVKHMLSQYYFHLAILLEIRAQNESILHKNVYVGCLLLHSLYVVDKSRMVFSGLDDRDAIKRQWLYQSHYRISQSGHLLTQLAKSASRDFLKKIHEICSHRNTASHIQSLVFEGSDMRHSVLFHDQNFMKKPLNFVESKIQVQSDQEVILMFSNDLRELMWLYLQYDCSYGKLNHSFHSFDLFRKLPFASSMNTVAPETLCHLDIVAFIVAVAFCRRCEQDVQDNSISSPSIMAYHLYTPEQGEWWGAATSLCSNKGSKHLDKFRGILQSGLESIRHLGHHNPPPVLLTLHLARFFCKWMSEGSVDGISANEIQMLSDRAEHYWSKVVNFCSKKAKGILTTGKSKSKLFDIRCGLLNDDDLDGIQEEGEIFIADRLVQKDKKEEAIQILCRLKTPQASFNRAMLYKKQAQSLLGNRMWQSISLSARKDYISLLTQSRDALYLTLDRLKMPGVDSGDPLNMELSRELTSIEHCLNAVTLDEYSVTHSDDEATEACLAKPKFLPDLDLTNGHGSGNGSWFTPPNNMFSTPVTHGHSNNSRQEARPSSERLDAQLRHLTDIQQNTIKNIEEHNAALRSQNETLLQTMMTELKDRFHEQKNSQTDAILDQLKHLESAVRDLKIEVKSISGEMNELKKMKLSERKPQPLQLHHSNAAMASEGQIPIDLASPALQSVYSSYMGYCGQPAVGSPIATHPAMFTTPPFLPPATIPEQGYIYPSPANIMKSEAQHPPHMLPSSVYQTQPTSIAGIKPKSTPVRPAPPMTSLPPHSYQIPLPVSSSVAYSDLGQDAPRSDSTQFSTSGLLSNIPPPVYSAITAIPSPDKTSGKNILTSTSVTTPIIQAIPATIKFGTPSQSSVEKPSRNLSSGATPPAALLHNTSHNRSTSESDHYVDDGHDPRPDFKPVIPLPDQVELVTGEEDEQALFEEQAKLYRYCDKEWKERGFGVLKILHNKTKGTVRVLMRRDQTHKICCNHFITPTMDLTVMPDKDKVWIWAAQDFADEKLVLEKFCGRFKTSDAAQNFQKGFYKGKMIVEDAQSKTETKIQQVKPAVKEKSTTSVNPLSELFKPEPGSWECDVCLVVNKKDVTHCASCQTTKPGALPQVVPAQTESKVTFKFGIPPTSTKSDKTPSTSSNIIVAAPLSDSTSAAKPFSFGSTSLFGPNSSVSISPIKPGSSTATSLFKTTTPAVDSSVQSKDPPKENKFSLQGFTFSKTPVSVPVKTEEKKQPEEPKKESIFSSLSFGSSKTEATNNAFTFNFPSTGSSTTTTTSAASTTTTKGIFSGATNVGPVLSFGKVATGNATQESSIFQIKDEKAFTAKPLFGKTVDPKADPSGSGVAESSKDESVEEFEPQVDFKPVIPLPDLVEVKTGEECEVVLFTHRAKLFRFDSEAKEWKERGIGDIKLLQNKDTTKVRLLMRRDQTHKVCANHFLSADMKLAPMATSEKSLIWVANDFADEQLKKESFAVRFKTVELVNEFKKTFEDAQKSILEEKPTAVKPTQTSTAKEVSKPLSELFKPAAGSWECSACLVMNQADASTCVSCSTAKDGSVATEIKTTIPGNSAGGNQSAFKFGSGNVSFGSGNTTAFKFGLSTPKTDSAPKVDSTTPSSQPFTFTWKPQEAITVKTPPTAAAEPAGFSFGSPSKHEFSFSGIKSPRSRDTSTCESEGGVVEDDGDHLYFEPVIPLPEKIEIVTGEEDEIVLFEHRAKLFRMSDGEFKERGLGDVRILQHKKNGKIRLLMRREHIHKICMNHYLHPDLEFRHKDEKSLYWVATDYSEEAPCKETFAIRFKTSDIAKDFMNAIEQAKELLASGKISEKSDKDQEKSGSDLGKSVKDPEKSVKDVQCKEDKELEIVFESKANSDQVARARKLYLPDNFYLYETNKENVCAGCIGCNPDSIQDIMTIRPVQETVVSTNSPQSNPTFTFGSASNIPATQSSNSLTFGGSAPKSSIFGGSAPQQNSIFGGNSPKSSIFGGNSPKSSVFGGNVFGGSTPQKNSIFGGNSPSGSIFGGNSSFGAKTSLFGNAALSSGGIFGGQTPASNTLFGPQSSQPQSSNDTTQLSFSELANKQSSQSIFKPASKDSGSAWVSKPLFGAKSPGAAEGAEGAAEDDYDPHYEPVIPMPELVQVSTGEEGWQELFSHRAKLYRFDPKTKEWKERGIGDFKIQFEPNLNKYRFLQRREQVHKLSCNHFLSADIKLERMTTSETAWMWIAMDFSDKKEGEAVKLAVRFKTVELANGFKSIFDSCLEKIKQNPPSIEAVNQEEERKDDEEEEQQLEEEEDYECDDEEDEQYDDEEEEEGEEDYIDGTVFFEDTCLLSLERDQQWIELGKVYLKIFFDGESYGIRLVASSSEDEYERFLDHLIAIQTNFHPPSENSVSWTALNEVSDSPPSRVEAKATFESAASLDEFMSAFQEGKDHAYNTGIEETGLNDVPESDLYYAQDYDEE